MLVVSWTKGSRWDWIYGEMRVGETMATGDSSQKSTNQADKNTSEAVGYWTSTICKSDLIAIQNFLNKNGE